jgi:hypothetical protein
MRRCFRELSIMMMRMKKKEIGRRLIYSPFNDRDVCSRLVDSRRAPRRTMRTVAPQ